MHLVRVRLKRSVTSRAGQGIGALRAAASCLGVCAAFSRLPPELMCLSSPDCRAYLMVLAAQARKRAWSSGQLGFEMGESCTGRTLPSEAMTQVNGASQRSASQPIDLLALRRALSAHAWTQPVV